MASKRFDCGGDKGWRWNEVSMLLQILYLSEDNKFYGNGMISKSNKFLFVFFIGMALCFECKAEPQGAMETLLMFFLLIGAICSVPLGFLLKYILYKADYEVSNWLIFFSSFLLSLLSLYAIFK